MKLKALTLLIGLILFSCSPDKSAGDKTEDSSLEIEKILADFENRLEFDVMQDDIGSISFSIFMDNKIIWSKAIGMADRDNHISADTNTIYRTASISKSITAYLMMLLVQDRTISLDEPVEKYLPEIKTLVYKEVADSIKITFRHLASHTAGLGQEPELSDAASGPISEWENKTLLSIPTTNVNTVPGSKYSYSNIGYGILGLALSRATGKPFKDLVEERIFNPLGMSSSFVVIPEEQKINLAAGYRWHPFSGLIDSDLPKKEHAGRGYKVPNGGIYSTPNDLARFLMAQCGNSDLLSDEYVEMMQTIQTPESKDYGYGLGYCIRNIDKGIRMIEHDGGVAGYNAMMVFNPESKTGIIIMRNYDFGLTHILLEPRTLLGALVRQNKK